MKKVLPLACLLAFTLFSSGASQFSTAADSRTDISLSVNGQTVTLSSMPQLIDNTLMVPLRDLSESLAVQVDWDGNARTASAVKGDRSIKLTIDSQEAQRGDQPYRLDAAPRMDGGKVYIPLRFFSESFDFNVYWDGLNKTVSVFDADKSLPTVGSLDNMKQLLQASEASLGYSLNTFIAKSAVTSVVTDVKEKAASGSAAPAAAPTANSAPAATRDEAKPSYSGTNVQVEGVDESDIIKTDGSYIYQVNKNRIIIAAAYPADQMKVVSTLNFDDKNFNAREIYVDNKNLVVIGSTSYPLNNTDPYSGETMPAPAAVPAERAGVGNTTSVQKIMIYPPRPNKFTTKAIVYELGDRTSLKKVREVELEGNYVSSRKVGSSLYLVANKGFNVYSLLRDNVPAAEKEAAMADATPSYRDSAAGDGFVKIGYEDIRYFPKSVQANYLLVAGLNLDQSQQKMDVTSYLGSGNQVYASQTQLYVTTNEYAPAAEPQATDSIEQKKLRIMPGETNSVIYKFGMDQGKVRYVGRGKVPGRTINQFAMDEQDGYFRIATTTGFAGQTGERTSKNNMYVLNESMSVAGKIEDIAPGEQIYSVRYAGNRAYMVTFRTVDPLFVIDLKNPQAPSILGKLKIPGYSNYLHPYDDTHLIGFGKDAVEATNMYGPKDNPGTLAYYQGMKMAMFDVSDVANPKELFNETIGGRGTDSELLHNHKALLFAKDKNLLAFPVTVMEATGTTGSTTKDIAQYGEFTFQGAYVYKLDLTNGFKLQGKITHLTDEDYTKAGKYMPNTGRSIERILYIGENLYTSSQQILKATDAATLKDVKSVTLP
jgi:inhibitor of cysteine peptidase